MKKAFYSLLLVIGTMLLFTQCEKKPVPIDLNPIDQGIFVMKSEIAVGCTDVQELWAGAGQNDISKGTLVGDVETEFLFDNSLRVTFNVKAGFILSEAHVWVGDDRTDLPKNAAPGSFPYAKYNGPFVFEIELNGFDEAMSIYVAAHGVVCTIDLNDLPTTVPYTVVYPGDRSYFTTTVGDPSSLAGTYNGWCIETAQAITPGVNNIYIADVYSSLEEIPDGIVDFPENFNKINWLINQDFVGKESEGCDGIYTWSDVQYAIWTILLAAPVAQGLQDWDECRVAELVSLADEGEDFVPECGQKFAIILDNEDAQNTIIEVPIRCGGCETAWAIGEFAFIDEGLSSKWGWMYMIDCDADE